MKINLKAHVAELRKREANKPQRADDVLLFWGTNNDKNYLTYLKGCVGSATTFLRHEPVETLKQVSLYCHQKRINRIISTSPTLLRKLLDWDKKKAPSLSDYAGSYFTIPPFKEGGEEIEVVFIQPLKQLVTVPYGKFMAIRLIRKLTKPDDWFKTPKFSWSILKPENEGQMYANFCDSFLISVDVETFKTNAVIRCISYCSFYIDYAGELCSHSVVFPLDSEWALAVMRKWNNLKAPKVMQNGKYDAAYFCRYSAPLYNYLYDTANMFHAWYAELPKDLGFLNSFFIREAVYWKDLAETNDTYEYYKYNSLDTWGTGCCWLAMIMEAPDWAIQNYLLEFPQVFPCHLAEMTGIERDMDRLEEAATLKQKEIDQKVASLNRILSIPAGKTFNTNSPPQVKKLLKLLGCGDLKSSDETHIKKAKFRHPFNARILNIVLEVRKARKLVSTYLTTGEDAKEFHRMDGTGNRILYALNPHGTDTSRLASKEHHFWCGLQIQNIPRPNPDDIIPYSLVKWTLKADPGFELREIDLEQAESRDTAYISGDETLIDNVENSPDFHCANASGFFGIPFDELYDVEAGKKLQPEIRQIAKNVNHGANYNMGGYVLIDTMGEENIWKAKKLIKLPKTWSFIEVAKYLLGQFHKTYPDIKNVFYDGVIHEILQTRKLSSKAIHYPDTEMETEFAWVRYCFGSPERNKQHLNAYIAHPPQSLNAQTLNKAWLRVFNDIAMHPVHGKHFKLIAQVHDSILYQRRIGEEYAYLDDMVKERMEIPVRIKSYGLKGKTRTFTVPADKGNGGQYWSDLK